MIHSKQVMSRIMEFEDDTVLGGNASILVLEWPNGAGWSIEIMNDRSGDIQRIGLSRSELRAINTLTLDSDD